MKNVLLKIAYDGTNFSGWQKQPKTRTVQGELEEVLGKICNMKVELNGTGRTDAGVHAFGQMANFKGDFGIPVEKIPFVANRLLSKKMKVSDVRILEAKEVEEDFHARFDAKGKEYIYRITSSQMPDLFMRDRAYQIEEKLDLQKMKKAKDHIVGTYDFKCFQASGGEEKLSTVRTIYGIDILENKNVNSSDRFGFSGLNQNNCDVQDIIISVKGDGFLYNMVRIIAGTLVDVGRNKIDADSLKEIIESKDRKNAGHTAPPWGLYMAEVYFNDNFKQKI